MAGHRIQSGIRQTDCQCFAHHPAREKAMAIGSARGIEQSRSRPTVVSLVLFFCVAANPLANAAEPWADRGLGVTNGLVLWLDASRQEQARHAAGISPLFSGGAVDVWYDG